MGAALASMVQALSCKDMWRYTCNSCDFKSECGDICNVEIETQEVEVKDSAQDKYQKRDRACENMPWYDFASSHMVRGNGAPKVRDERLHVVPVIKPWAKCYLPAPEGEPACTKHEFYCRQRLMVRRRALSWIDAR